MCKNFLIALLFSVLFCITACSTAGWSASGTKNFPSEVDLNNLPTADQYPDSDGIVLYENISYDVDYVPRVGIETYKDFHKIYRVFKNEESFMGDVLMFDDKTTFEFFMARVVKPDGTSKEVSEQDIYRIKIERSNQKNVLKNQGVGYIFPGLEKGDIIEIKYRSISRYFYFSDTYFVQSSLPKKYSRFEIKIPNFVFDAGFDFRYRTRNISIPDPVYTKGFGDTGDRSYTWENRDIKRFKPEPLMGNADNYTGLVELQLAYWNTWNGYARDHYDRNYKPVIDNMSRAEKKRVKSKVDELTAGKTDMLDKIKTVTKFVQTFSYSDIPSYFGHEIKPNNIGTILDRKYGDCKDHASLLIVMLREMGVEASPALIAAYDSTGIDPKFVYDIFNHVMVKVRLEGGQVLLLDPTSKFTQFGKLPEMDENTYMLELKSEKDNKEFKIKLEKTPASGCFDNKVEKNVKGKIENGVAKYEVTIKFTGHQADMARYVFENAHNDIIEQVMRMRFPFYLYDAAINSFTMENLYNTELPFVLKYAIELPKSENKGIPVIPLKFFDEPVYPNYVYLKNRTKPVTVPSVYSTSETYEMSYDSEKYSIQMPEKLVNAEFSEGNYSSWRVSVDNKPGKILLTVDFAQKEKNIKLENVSSLLRKTTDFSNLQRIMYWSVVVPSTAVKFDEKTENKEENVEKNTEDKTENQ